MVDKYNPWFLIHLLFICFSLSSHLSVGFDSISANQSLSGDQTISSEHGGFILGFFVPGNTSRCYIGIWYNSATQAVVWVANRETSVSYKFSSTLTISNGSLVLLNEKGVIVWSTNTSSKSNSVKAVLLEDGNLVLRDETVSMEPQWQSFDHPTDTWLPGGKIGFNKITKRATGLVSWKNREGPAPGLYSLEKDMNGSSQFYILRNRSDIIWSSGNWNGKIFSLVPEMRLDYIYNFTYIDNENESYFSYWLYNNSLKSRLLIDAEGQIQQVTWLDSAKQWNLFWSQPRVGPVYCGGFGIVIGNTEQGRESCDCLPGFLPKSSNE